MKKTKETAIPKAEQNWEINEKNHEEGLNKSLLRA